MKLSALFLLLIILGIAASVAAQSNAKGFIGLGLADAPRGAGAMVGMVKPGSPAERSGVMTGDIVTAINGTPVDSAQVMTARIMSMSPGQTATLSVIRGSGNASRRISISVVLGSAGDGPAAGASAPPVAPRSAAPPPTKETNPSAGVHALAVSGTVRMTDPIEQAFTVDVPTGWRSEAGLARIAALQVNPYVRSLSPDKMTYLMIGEPTVPTYTPPSQMGNTIGLPEGSLTSSALGGQGMVLHYMPGAEFAHYYAQSMLQGICPSMKFVSAKDRPDLARAGDAAFPTVIPSRSEGGEARYSCTHNKQEMEVRVDAATRITRDNIMWGATVLTALIAPKDQADKAEELLTNMARSMKFTDAWTQKQNNISQQAAIQIAQHMQETLRQERTFIQKLNAEDENFESMDELVSGFSTYHDAKTGNDYSLSNSNPNKWIDDSTGRIISTATNNKPTWGPAYHALTRGSQ